MFGLSLKIIVIYAILLFILIFLRFFWLKHPLRMRVLDLALTLCGATTLFIIPSSIFGKDKDTVMMCFLILVAIFCFWLSTENPHTKPPEPGQKR
jgi:hypothetical protein